MGLGALMGIACGVPSAAFLWLLEQATRFRTQHEARVYTLPLAGLVIGFIYDRWGQSIRGGNSLVLDTLHEASPQLPRRGILALGSAW